MAFCIGVPIFLVLFLFHDVHLYILLDIIKKYPLVHMT